MASIPYPKGFQQAQQDESPKGTGEPEADLVRQFYPQAKREIVKGEYLRRRWLPRQGHRFYTLIRVLRGYCSYSVKQGETPCFPSYETIAKACKVSRRTICTWMARDEQGHFIHPKHGEALNRFVAAQPRRRYDAAGQRQVKTSNLYLVRMDDPAVPEDEPLIWQKATELAQRHLESQAQEQEREARRQKVEEAAQRAAPVVERDCTRNNAQKLHSERGAESAQDHPVLPLLFNTDTIRSTPEELAAPAIRNSRRVTDQQANWTGDERDEASEAVASKSNGATAPGTEDRFRRAACSDESEEPALAAARDVLAAVLATYGDFAPAAQLSARGWVRKLGEAGVPAQQLAALIELACRRVERARERGRVIRQDAKYFTRTLENAVGEARRTGWNVAQLEAIDGRNQQKWRRDHQATPAPAQPSPSETRRPARRATRQAHPPTPAEAEALVIELGQQDETYRAAQAQVQQLEEERQAREAAHRAAQEAVARLAKLPADPRAQVMWQLALERLETTVSKATFSSWFRRTRGMALQGQRLVVQVPTSFVREHLETRFQETVGYVLREVQGTELEVCFVCAAVPEEPGEDDAPTAEMAPGVQGAGNAPTDGSPAPAVAVQQWVQARGWQLGDPCDCGCPLKRDLEGDLVCVRCLPPRGYAAWAEEVDRLYPRKKRLVFGQ